MAKYSEYVNTELLRQERYVKRITMAKMAQLLGKKSESSYSNLENGVVEAKISDINKVAEILDKPAVYFFRLKVQESCTLIVKEQ
jgi:transcriptional regulator with XRE-family HTH domain